MATTTLIFNLPKIDWATGEITTFEIPAQAIESLEWVNVPDRLQPILHDDGSVTKIRTRSGAEYYINLILYDLGKEWANALGIAYDNVVELS